ncbi:PREDICTED: probable RNA-binding protein 19 [Drosophila arizonae]|uniref:Probable RNA-binding protein 19 n=1 Tax=Drosophila arizonae TaxID=7263 RepID=A0ABM1PT06_DROAR|nr:PREDICTED: probable RNA-binding protein 19 [Drosophila arizonae]
MSRIIVKQLPKQISEDKLRNIFGTKGTITDLQLKYTPDGKFRQFCFVGYSSEAEAQAAIKHFNNTCIQTSRVRVEPCAALGSEEKPQSWSKYAKDSKKNLEKLKAAQPVTKKVNEKKERTNKVDEILAKHKDDPAFQEFMQAHDKTRALWANDAGIVAAQPDKETVDAQPENNEKVKETSDDDDDNDDDEEEQVEEEESQPVKLAEKPISDMEYMKSLMAGKAEAEAKPSTESKSKTKGKAKQDKADLQLFTIKIHNVPYKAKRSDIIKFFKPLKPYSVRLPSKVHGFCYVGFKTEHDMARGMMKNKSFILGKQVFFSDFTDKNQVTKAKKSGEAMDANSNPITNVNAKWQQQQDSLSHEENISESGRIFFRNLAYTTTEEDLQKLFEPFGPLVEVNLPVDKVTRQIKGFGTVTFMMPEHALKAFNALDGTDFHGRLLHLLPGKELDNAQEPVEDNDPNLSFKQKKALKLKQNAQKPIGWNTLFLGANAVAEILAKQFKMSKERILDTSEGGSSAAVRLALGETQIVVEMKKFLEEEGVRLSAFDEPTQKRSKTVILAKNLPAATEVADLTPIFSKFGPIGRIVLPPSGVTALIEFCDPSEARQAFKKLAYSKFKNVPLYLEWAPEDTFTKTLNGEAIIPKTEPKPEPEPKTEQEKELELEQKPKPDPVAEDADDEPEPNTTIFLRNLNFKTVTQTIQEHFQSLGTIHTIEIAKRKDPQNPKQLNSLGYGFIQFKRAAVAAQALKDMQLTKIDGNLVELKRSDRVLKTQDDGARRRQVAQKKQTGTKILVRNIPFQAHHHEVRDIFKAFGELTSLRLPKKMTPGEDSHRGFCFVDYTTKADAKRAFDALSASTHLYGRRLVLEWASNEDQQDVEELRKRTAIKFDGSQAAVEAKRSRRAYFDVDSNVPQETEDNEDEE